MPLNEDEQRILEEIERQFYEEDPELAHSVASASLRSRLRPHRRLAVLGFIVGLVVMVVSLKIVWFATLGFILMLASAGWLAMTFRRGSDGGSDLLGKWLERARQRWSRNG
ncbi:MAG: DUF3040 domain-containing protein [Acidimicrobiia bacterium]|jgi:hypothetical protein